MYLCCYLCCLQTWVLNVETDLTWRWSYLVPQLILYFDYYYYFLFFYISSQIDGGLVQAGSTKIWRVSVPYCEYRSVTVVKRNILSRLKRRWKRAEAEKDERRHRWKLNGASESCNSLSPTLPKHLKTHLWAQKKNIDMEGKEKWKAASRKSNFQNKYQFVAVKVSSSHRIKAGNWIES